MQVSGVVKGIRSSKINITFIELQNGISLMFQDDLLNEIQHLQRNSRISIVGTPLPRPGSILVEKINSILL